MTNSGADSTSRRDFLKTSTAVVLGAGLVERMQLSAGAYAGGDDTIRVGVIGCGGRGNKAAVQACSTEGGVKLVAMADMFEDRLDDSAEQIKNSLHPHPDRFAVDGDHRFVGFDAYKQLIDSDVDLVILSTPPGFRPIHLDYAVRAGKHVFMEKPVAVDAPGVRSVLESVRMAEGKGRAIGVGLQRHHDPGYVEAINRIHDGEIGDILAMRAYWNTVGVWEPRKTRDEVQSEMEYQLRNWYYYTWLSGDHILEQHIHNIDVCNWMKNAYPVRAAGVGGRQVRTDKKYGDIYDHHAVEFEYADGSRMFSQCRHIPNCWNSVSEHAQGTLGRADFGVLAKEEGLWLTDGGRWRYRGEKVDPYQVEHDDLFAAIRSGTPYNEGENGAKSTMTALLGRMASYSGKELSWDEALNSDVSLAPDAYAMDANPSSLPDADGRYAIPTPGVTRVV